MFTTSQAKGFKVNLFCFFSWLHITYYITSSQQITELHPLHFGRRRRKKKKKKKQTKNKKTPKQNNNNKMHFLLTSISSLASFSLRKHLFCVCPTATSASFWIYLPSILVLAFISCSWSFRWAIIWLRCWISSSRSTLTFWICFWRLLIFFLPSSSLSLLKEYVIVTNLKLVHVWQCIKLYQYPIIESLWSQPPTKTTNPTQPPTLPQLSTLHVPY